VKYVTFTCNNGHTYHYTEQFMPRETFHQPRADKTKYAFTCPLCAVPLKRVLVGPSVFRECDDEMMRRQNAIAWRNRKL